MLIVVVHQRLEVVISLLKLVVGGCGQLHARAGPRGLMADHVLMDVRRHSFCVQPTVQPFSVP